MNKAERAKMEKRIGHRFDRFLWFSIDSSMRAEVFKTVAREVDRAVRAERKAWHDAEELRSASLRRADDELIDGMKRVGRKRT